MQDAYLAFHKVSESYPRVIDPRHFMALYKTTLRNKMHDHARYVLRKRECVEITSKDVSELFEERIGDVTNYGYVAALLNEAPEELKMALALIAENPTALDENISGKRENLNMRIRRVLGISQDFSFDTVIRQLLAED
mgnify:CR=1 FL=1